MRVARTPPLAGLLTAALLLVASGGAARANDAGRLSEPGGHEDFLQDIPIEVSVRLVSVGNPEVADASPPGTKEIQLVSSRA